MISDGNKTEYDQDLVNLRRFARSLKSSSTMLGMNDVSDSAEKLERVSTEELQAKTFIVVNNNTC
jgi:chemotaxis protein histidine kinase CheA